MKDLKEQHTDHHNHQKNYILGFNLAVILTMISFYLVYFDSVSPNAALSLIIISAFAQILVHLRYFLHLDFKEKNRWNMMALLFTALLIFIFIGGSIWVMTTLNSRMM